MLLSFIAGCGLLQAAQAAVNRRTPVVEAVEKALPSVVNVGTERLVQMRYTDPTRRFRNDLFDQFFSEFFRAQGQGTGGYQLKHSLGSGVIIDANGYILTNYHVIERASKIRVTLSDETSYDAVFLAGDEISDLALIKIEPAEPLKAVTFGRDDDLMLGETVIVLGNPFGLAQTVTVGVLSAKNREARYEGQVLYRDILQTDAAVNPGSSGGPMLNIDGEVIGINVAIYREAQNIGFAVPITRARALLAEWLSPRSVSKAWLGFEPEATNGAIRATSVDPKTAPNMKNGDIIRSVAVQPVNDLYTFNKALLSYKAGDRFDLLIERDGQGLQQEVTLIALPKPSGPLLAKSRLGLELGTQPSEGVAAKIGFSKGLPISGIVSNSVAAKAGLHPGLLLTRINDSEVDSLDAVGLALERVKPGDRVVLGLVSLEENNSFIMAQSSSVQLDAEGAP